MSGKGMERGKRHTDIDKWGSKMGLIVFSGLTRIFSVIKKMVRKEYLYPLPHLVEKVAVIIIMIETLPHLFGLVL